MCLCSECRGGTALIQGKRSPPPSRPLAAGALSSRADVSADLSAWRRVLSTAACGSFSSGAGQDFPCAAGWGRGGGALKAAWLRELPSWAMCFYPLKAPNLHQHTAEHTHKQTCDCVEPAAETAATAWPKTHIQLIFKLHKRSKNTVQHYRNDQMHIIKHMCIYECINLIQ